MIELIYFNHRPGKTISKHATNLKSATSSWVMFSNVPLTETVLTEIKPRPDDCSE